MYVQLALLAAQMFLGIVTQKRPKKMTFEEFLEQNKGDETRPIPYIRGRWKTTPQRIWLGDYSLRAVERDSHWTDWIFFGGLGQLLDFITVGYTYYVGQVFALTWGPINRVHQVYVEDLPCAVAPAADNAGGTILLDDPGLFGGDQPPGQGGIYGLCDILPGDYSQGVNEYLDRVITGTIPALRGVAALIIRGRTGFDNYGYFSAHGVGGSPQLRTWAVEIMAWPDNFGTGFHRLPDDSYNRIDVLYEWVTKPDYGAEYPIENINMASWLAAQETIYDEENGFSGEINTGGNVGEVITELKASIDAEIYEHPRDGLTIKLVRKDYSIPSLTVLSQANVNGVEEYTPGDYADSYNKVILNFTNADNNYQPRPAIYEDPANFHIQQRISTREVEYPGVANADLAQKLVTRDGRMLGQPWPPLVLNAGEDGRELWPGEVFKFEWPNPLLEKIFRVSARTPSLSYDGERNFRIVSTEDQYSTGLAAFGSPSESGHTNPAAGFGDSPPAAEWDEILLPPDGLQLTIETILGGTLSEFITGAIIFGDYASGAQYARIWITEPGGVQTLSPLRLLPDADNKAQFVWPALARGTYQFCVQTYSITDATNGTKVCASIVVASPSPSMSVSRSVSPSASISLSASISPSASVSQSASLSPTGSPSLSPSASESPSASVSPSSGAIFDDFNRADNPTSLGTSSSGHPWVVPSADQGVWGISGNTGTLVTATNASLAYIECGDADVSIEVTFVGLCSRQGILFRYTDADNYLWYYFFASVLRLWKREAGVNTELLTASQIVSAGAIFKVGLAGSNIEIFYNGTSKGSITETHNQTATKHGLLWTVGGGADRRWDDLLII